MAGASIGDIVAHLKLEINDFQTNLNTATDKVKELSENFRGTEAAGRAFSTVGTALTAGITAPVMAIGASVVKTQMQFQDSMAKVKALSGATGEEFDKLKNTAMEWGEKTKYSASECADALGFMALAGYDAEASAAALPGVLNLAASSGMELADASDLVTDYLSAFGLEADQAGRMADVLAKAQANSNTTTQQLGEAFKNCAVNAHNAGMSLEETTSILGKLADQGLKGSEAGTALNAMIRDMTSKMKNGNIEIGNTKVAVQDANGNFRSMTDIIRDVSSATEGMGDAEKMAALQTTFTADSIKAMGILCNTGADDIDKFTNSLENSKGSAEDIANTMNNTLSGSLTELGSAWEGFQLRLGDSTGVLTKLVQGLTAIVRAASKIPDPIKQIIVTLALFAAAIGPTLLGIGKLMQAWGKMKEVMGILKVVFGLLKLNILDLLSTAITHLYVFITDSLIPALSSLWSFLLANPIVLVIAAIALLVGAFIYLWNNCEGFRNFWIGLWEDIKSSCGPAIEGIKQAFKNIVPQIMEIWNGLGDFFKGFGELLKGIINGDWQQIFDGLTQMGEAWHNICVALWTAIGNLVMSALQGLWQWIINLGSSFLSWLGGILSNLLTTVTQGVSNIVNAIVSFFSNLPATIWYWLCFVISYIALWTSQMIQKGIEAGSQFVQNVVQWIQQLPGKIWTWLVNTITKATTWASQMVSKAQQAGSQFLQRVSTYIQQLPGRIWSFLSNAISKAVTFASQFPAKAQRAGSQFLQKVCTYIQQLPGRVWSSLSNTIGRAIAFASNFASKGLQAARTFTRNIINGLAGLPGRMASIGSRIVSGIISGITGAAGRLYSTMSSIASKALSAAKEKLGIHSPSRVFRDIIGRSIPEGIVVGIEANTKSAIDSVKQMAGSLVSAIDLSKLSDTVTLTTSGVDINTTNPYNNGGNIITTMQQLIDEFRNSKNDIDYNAMGKAFERGARNIDSTIYMNSEKVGIQTASTVKRQNTRLENRADRLGGRSDNV